MPAARVHRNALVEPTPGPPPAPTLPARALPTLQDFIVDDEEEEARKPAAKKQRGAVVFSDSDDD